MKYETAWFYCLPSRELMRLKKGLIKIWRDLAKNKTKQIKKQAQQPNKTSVHTKEFSINDGTVAMGKCQKYIFVR